MRHLTVGVLACVCLGAAVQVQAQATADPQVTAVITKFIDAFNKGDMTAAAATHAPDADLAIIDEVPPFLWRGAQAFKAWAGDLQADSKRTASARKRSRSVPPRASSRTAATRTSWCRRSSASSREARRCARTRTWSSR